MGVIFLVLLLVSALSIAFVWWRMRRRVLTGFSRARVVRAWDHVELLESSMQKVLEADKVLDLALTILGVKGSIGEKLKIVGPRFSNIDAIWRAHKLRNRIAHEPGISIADEEAQGAVRVFREAVWSLLG